MLPECRRENQFVRRARQQRRRTDCHNRGVVFMAQYHGRRVQRQLLQCAAERRTQKNRSVAREEVATAETDLEEGVQWHVPVLRGIVSEAKTR